MDIFKFFRRGDRHKHVYKGRDQWYSQCEGCGRLVRRKGSDKNKHKHVWGPWRVKYPSVIDGKGDFQIRECTVQGCRESDTTQIGRRWYPDSWRIHL